MCLPMNDFMKESGSLDMHRDLETVYRVSSYFDFPFTAEEVADYFLPGVNISGSKLLQMISEGEFAEIPFKIQNSYLLTREDQNPRVRSVREAISAQKLNSAARFSTLLIRLIPWIMTIAVTGSVAYGSAGKRDDIDLFIITKINRLWISCFLALVFVRVFKFLRLQPVMLLPFCMSYVHDESGFRNEARKNVNPLFARELLKAIPLAGKEHYRKILEENEWVRAMHSSQYNAKVESLPDYERIISPARGIFLLDWAEGLAFFFLSRYLRVRAYLTNLKLKSHQQQMRLFEPVISRNSCVYTSNFYRWLRDLWEMPPAILEQG